ncbi:hypothetical protein [Streptomyces sp. MH60]|uniref:hypothetical protein n=1 Tax=Streptomyces sp. MH60 TaxID=1940758 RepID=UPI000CEDE08E|nr:hypothetical protein [Streptomyces sp. MH60]PPS89415.1 hypothetical protein BZZ08_01561 [Streptomyces sp. MH60]
MKVTRLSRLLFPAAAVGALLLATACDNVTKPSSQGAAVMCEEFIKKGDYLKSPGSAKFSGVSDTTIKTLRAKKPWKYRVSGWVDSQNSFGALVRNKYVCEISTKDADTWHLDVLDLGK